MAMGNTGTVNVTPEMINNAKDAIQEYKDTVKTLYSQLEDTMSALIPGNFSENAADTGTSTTSVVIPNNATLDVKDTSYMIAEGDIEVGDFAGKDTATIKNNMAGVHNNSKLSVDAQCQLWTGNINVNGATVNLDGMTYVADDMTLKGTGSNVTLGKNNKNNNAK